LFGTTLNGALYRRLAINLGVSERAVTAADSAARLAWSTLSTCRVTEESLAFSPPHIYRLLTMNDQTTDDCCLPLKDTPDLRPVEGEQAEDELAALAKAISHPARVRIVRMLSGFGTAGCGDLVAELPLAQSTVSQHLKILREAGLVRGDVEGPRRSYCIDTRGMRRLRALIGAL